MRDKSDGNRRNYYRYKTFDKLCGILKVVSINNQPIGPNQLNVIIHDISEGGFSFLSDNYINLNLSIFVEVNFLLMNEPVILNGEIIRLDKYISGFQYLYGVKLSECNISDLYKLLVKTGIKFEKVNSLNSSLIKPTITSKR